MRAPVLAVALLLAACPPTSGDDDDDAGAALGGDQDAGTDDDDAGATCGGAVCAPDEQCVDRQQTGPDCPSAPQCMTGDEGAPCFDNDDPCTHAVACDAPLVCRTTCIGPCDGYLQGACAQPAGDGDVCEDEDEQRRPCAAGLTCADDDGDGTSTCGDG
jgi:hypothetical protein